MFWNIIISISFVLFFFYAIIILLYRKWFLQLQYFKVNTNHQPQHKFSIIIPARNEEENIGQCLSSIIRQNYPSDFFEIIVVDDHSTDKTVNIVEEFKKENEHIKLIKLKDVLNGRQLNAYKKKSIETAIENASYDWIVTTDADCVVTPNWLKNFDAYIQDSRTVFVAAPVAFTYTATILSVFQYLDFLSLQGITAAAVSAGFHSMCNGANLAYNKKVFYEVNGFKDIDNIASGDDMLLMNKIKEKYPQQIGFIFSKEVIVKTAPMPDWKSFLNQRIRWASKANKYNDKSIFWVLWLVYLFNLILFVSPFLSIFHPVLCLYWLGLIILKTVVELSFTIPVGKFFGKAFTWAFLFLQPIHIGYTVIAGWLGMFGSYRWKDRKVK
jgi:cellulose synthase/poly-beta-1,6-N-acetylglucosamine synthase-like glycosyltransferase